MWARKNGYLRDKHNAEAGFEMAGRCTADAENRVLAMKGADLEPDKRVAMLLQQIKAAEDDLSKEVLRRK